MKKFMTRILVGISVFTLLVASASARLSNTVKAVVPFSFTIGEKTLPAGTYTFEPLSTTNLPSVIVVRSMDRKSEAIVLTIEAQTSDLQPGTKMEFNQYNDQYFLASIWTPGNQIGAEVPKSAAEKNLLKSGAQAKRTTLVLQ
jgi:hypothetical protein